MHTATRRTRIGRSSPSVLFLISVAACADPASVAGPALTAPLMAKQDVATPAALVVATVPNGPTSVIGSAVGPGGALFVTDPTNGRILRVEPNTGAVTTFASGLPINAAGGGGAYDLAFIGGTAYVLVSFVTPEAFGGSDIDGIYRVDGPNSFTVIADVGAFNRANPPETDFFISTGVPYALERFRNGFLVTDGHLNRVLYATLDGEVTELIAFGDVVPTGLAVSGNTVYMAEAGPLPHLPESGRVVAFDTKSTTATVVASGARLLVDVEFGRGRTLFALSNGVWDGQFAGEPALPNTGSLVRANGDGTFTTIVEGLDRPTTLEVIGNTAWVVGLGGQVYRIDNIAGPPFGNADR